MSIHPDAKKCKEAHAKAQRLLKQGREAEEKGRIEAAKRHWKQAWFQAQKAVKILGDISVQPLCSAILINAALIAYKAGELDEATRLIRDGWDRKPSDEDKARFYKLATIVKWSREQKTKNGNDELKAEQCA
jgi:hypothetical protein